MEIDYLDLQRVILLVNFAISKNDSNVEFYNTVKETLQPYAVMLHLLQFAQKSKLTIPTLIAMDINSIVREFGEEFNNAYGGCWYDLHIKLRFHWW